MATPNQIANLRKQRGLSQQQLAERLGVHWITVSKLERGKQKLTTDWMNKIADALDVGTWSLLQDTMDVVSISISGMLSSDGQVFDPPPERRRTAPIYKWTIEDPLAIWVEVDGDGGYPPFQQGDVLQFKMAGEDPRSYVGRLCYAQSSAGKVYFGTLANGSTAGLFDIQTAGRPTWRDVAIVKVLQITMAYFYQPDGTRIETI